MKKRVRSILVLALPYILPVLLPLISIFCLGSMVVFNYHERIISDKQKSIESAFERFLQRIDDVENLSFVIEQNNIITEYALASLKNEGHTVIDSMEVRDLLYDLGINNDVAEMYLYDTGNDQIITTRGVLSDAKLYFEYTYVLDGYTAQECVERFQGTLWGREYIPSRKARLNGISTEVIEYRISIPIRMMGKMQPQLIIVMETEKIFSDFYDVLGPESEFYLYDSSQQLIFSSGSRYQGRMQDTDSSELKQILKEESTYGMVCHSEDGSWKAEVYIPDLIDVKGGGWMSPYVWLLMVVPLFVSVVLSVFFTYRNHREIQDTLMLFEGHKKESEKGMLAQESYSYKMIREYAGMVISENNRYQESISRLENSKKYEILDKLIRNTYENEREMKQDLVNEKFNIQDGNCVVLCIRYHGADYRTLIVGNMTVKDLVKHFLKKLKEGNMEVFDTSSRETICVLAVGDEDMEGIVRDIISRFNVECAYCYSIEVEIGVGNSVSSLYHLSESYKQARAVIRYRETSGRNVYLYSELEKLKNVYYFPREYEDRIYNYILVGKQEEAQKIIKNIYKENFENNPDMLSATAIDDIRGRIKVPLISLVEKYDIGKTGVLADIGDEQNISKFFDMVCEAADIIAESIMNKKNMVQKNSAAKILQYINDNYCDNMLSVKQISQALRLHENYISNLFRNEYGESLSAFIERHRIEKACDLIKNTDMKIADISKTVGYTSDASFRRAFKKIIGVTPGEYREG